MSDSGQDKAKPRRWRNEGDDFSLKTGNARRRSYSNELEDYQPQLNDWSADRRADSYRHGDRDTDRDRSGRRARDRRERNSGRGERDYRAKSRSQERSGHHRRSRSPPVKRRRRSESNSTSPPSGSISRRSRAPLPSQAESFRGEQPVIGPDGKPVEKEKPNYEPTGLLAKEANTVAGTTTVLKYHEPPEARKPPSSQQWRIYVFKGKQLLDTIYLHNRSAWLLGRDEKVTDYYIEHPSASKQHAVIQFRYISKMDEFGTKTGKVKPYLIDLDSANGTQLNGKKIVPSRYIEVMNDDVIVFGDSEREYVVMLPEAERK
jgi:smad nuclear-interacting protein 1